MSVKKQRGFELDFDVELPERRRVGRERTEYKVTIEEFLNSEKDYARVKVPKDEKIKLSSLRLGFKNAINKLEVSDKAKPVMLEGKLYLVTKSYSDKKSWIWTAKRKPKK